MIDMQELVYALNEHIGRDMFALYLGTNGAPNDELGLIVGTVNIGQVPYAFSTAEIDATSLNITFTFDLPCGTHQDDIKRDKALYRLADKLLSWKKIGIQYPNGTKYVLNTFFEMLPMGQPYVDSGKITQQLTIAGKALLQNALCGAIIGNNETITIDGSPVLFIDKVSSFAVTHDADIDLSNNSYIPSVTAIACSCTLKMTCLFMGNTIDAEMWQIGEGVMSNPDKEYTVESKLTNADGFVIGRWTKKMKVISVSNVSSAGVFNRYELTMQYTN